MYRSRCYKCLTSSAILISALTIGGASFAQKPPMTGTAVPEFKPLDQAVLDYGYLVKCNAATVAVSKDGELLYSRGYGWRDARLKQPTPPDTLMRTSYCSRAITAAAVRTLIRDDKLTLDTKVFDFLKIAPPPGARQDPRLEKITVAHLLNDSGGWSKKETFDPMFHTRQIEQSLQLPHPARQADIIRYILGQPLQFDPGYQKAASNFGYCVLGRVIEKASGQPYGTYIREAVFKPLEITDIKLARNLPKDRDPREVWYPGLDVSVEILDSCAGLIASAPDLCTFMDHYWMTGEPRYAGQTGQWAYAGVFSCTTALIRQRRDGYNIAVLYNGMKPETLKSGREELESKDREQLKKMIDDAMDKVAKTDSK